MCLYLAALGASIGLLETIVSNVKETMRVSRKQACIWAGGLAFVISIVPALSRSVLGEVSLGGAGLLEILDNLLINWGLPMAALLLIQFVFHFLPESKVREIFSADPQMQDSAMKMYYHWRFALKWVSIPVIVIALVLQAIGLAR